MSTSSSLVSRLYSYARDMPSHDALIHPRITLSYAQLAQQVVEQVKIFQDIGISPSSVVGVQSADDIQHLVFCLAATHLGAASCTIPSHEAAESQAMLSQRCGVTQQVSAELAVAPSLVQSHSNLGLVATPAPTACLLFSTSGTTGEPKLVVHQDRDLVAQAHRHIGSQQERFMCLASVEHNFAKRHRLYALAVGATNVFLDASADALVNQILALQANVVHVSAFQAQELLGQSDSKQLAHIRLKLGGGHVPLKLRQRLKDNITSNLQAGYGTTETGAIAFTSPSDAGAGESVGQPLPGIDVRIVDPDKQPLATGTRGEVAVRCEGMFREYLAQPELTDVRLQNGWFYTGDMGYLDKQKRIHLCGRSDDMFVFNSMNVYPQDIESTILAHPSIDDVAVIPKASSVHGNIPVALVVFKSGVKQRLPELRKYVRKRVGVRSPRQYIIVPEIPKTAAGKVSRSKAQQLPDMSGEIRSALLDLIGADAMEHLKPSLVRDFKLGDQDIKLNHLTMDSLGRMEFLVALELEYNTVITPQELGTFRYLGNVVARILSPNAEPKQENEPTVPYSHLVEPPTTTNAQPYVVRLFQRTFRYCDTVAQLNKAIATLEDRITPEQVDTLATYHATDQLLPQQAAPKYQIAVSNWLVGLQKMMRYSGKSVPEPFVASRLSPTANHYSGSGLKADKTLLICFPPRDLRQMGIPNAIFLQHIDAHRFDVLMISSTFTTGYRSGKSEFGSKLSAFSEWLANQGLTGQYRCVRTLGFSAGARAAIATGYLLNAELAVSVNGRFHRERHVLKNIDQTIAIRKASRAGRCSQILLSYTPDNPRDRIYAKVIGALVGGRRAEIRHKHEKLKHLIFQQLLEQGELAALLDRTILLELGTNLLRGQEKPYVIRFPIEQTE